MADTERLTPLPPNPAPIGRAIQQTVSGFVDYLFGEESRSSAFGSVLSNLTDRETLSLRRQIAEFLNLSFRPESSSEQIASRVERVVYAHAMVGVQTEWVFDVLGALSKIGKSAALAAGMDLSEANEFVSHAAERLNILVSQSLKFEKEHDTKLQDSLDGISLLIGSTSTVADFARESLELISQVDGIAGAYFGRPDEHGNLKFEHIGGRSFQFFKTLVESDRLPAISVDPNKTAGLGPAGRSWRSGDIQCSSVIEFDPTMSHWADIYLAMGIRSTAAVPVLNREGKAQALLGLYSQWPAYFNSRRRHRFLEQVRQSVSFALVEIGSSTIMSYETRRHYRWLLEKRKVEMHFQPIVNLKDGSLHKLEALARLIDSDGSLISPGNFLQAFGSDELVSLFEIGLAASVEALREWNFGGLSTRVSINLPVQGLNDPRYMDLIGSMVNNGLIPPGQITLELTEEEEFQTSEKSSETLRRLKQMGIAISQDDLGSGYSSLQRLDKIGFDEVKIDQALVRSTADPQNSLKLIEHLTDLSHDLGIGVVVEGLESEALIEAAITLGADYGQGYAISRPIPQPEVIPWLRSFHWRRTTEQPTTNLGALAAVQRWVKTVKALSAYPDVFDAKALVAELGLMLNSFPSAVSHPTLATLLRSMKDGITSQFGETVDQMKVELLRADPTGESHAPIRRTAPVDTPPEVAQPIVQPSDSADGGPLRGLISLQKVFLHQLIDNGDPESALRALCRGAESIVPRCVATVMAIGPDSNLHLVAGPSLTEEAQTELAKLVPGPHTGSCGNVVYRQEPVYVADIDSDPKWNDLRDFATRYRLRSCWSTPIRGEMGAVIGTFALTNFEGGSPTAAEVEVLEQCAAIASLALIEIARAHPQVPIIEPAYAPLPDKPGKKLVFKADTGAIISFSPGLPGWYGYSEEEFSTMTIFDLNPFVDSKALHGLALASEHNRPIHMRTKHILRSGEIRDMEYFAKIFELDSTIVFESIYFDITEDLDASGALVRDRIVHDQILDAISVMVFLLTPLGDTISMNRTCAEFIGVSQTELVGRPLPLEKLLLPDQFHQVRLAIASTLKGETAENLEVTATNKDGQSRLLEMRVSSIYGPTGALMSLLFVAVDITDRKVQMDRLVHQQSFYDQLVESVSNLLVVMDTDGHIVQCNPAFEDFVGMPLENLKDRQYMSQRFFTPDSRQAALKWFTDAIVGELQKDTVAPWIDKKGELHIIRWRTTAIHDDDGQTQFLVCAGIDITEERHNWTQAQRASIVFNGSLEGILIVDSDGIITDVNSGFTLLTGFNKEDLVGKPSTHWASDQYDKEFFAQIRATLAADSHWTGTVWSRRSQGSEFPVRTHISTVRDPDGTPAQYVIFCSDVSEVVEAHERLSSLTSFDNLTKLPNRTLLSEKLTTAFSKAQIEQSYLALVYLDLDGFKSVNDRYGHNAGDKLFIELAERMVGSLRQTDTVARIGGDEFVCLLPDLSGAESCANLLDQLVARIEEPFRIGSAGDQASLSASIGVVLYHGEDVDPDSVLRLADDVMYRARNAGGNRYLIVDTTGAVIAVGPARPNLTA